MASPTFGLELLYKNYKQDIRGKVDAAVCFIHWKLISAGFFCIGLGEDVRKFSIRSSWPRLLVIMRPPIGLRLPLGV